MKNRYINEFIQHRNPDFYEFDKDILDANSAYIWGTWTNWKVKRMMDYDTIYELIQPEDSIEKLKAKASFKPLQTLLAYKHEMEEGVGGYNALNHESIYEIHHVPPLGRR